MEHNITINGESFTITNDCGEWFWVHNVAGEPGKVWADSDYFPTMAAALKDAEQHMVRWELEHQVTQHESERRLAGYEAAIANGRI